MRKEIEFKGRKCGKFADLDCLKLCMFQNLYFIKYMWSCADADIFVS